MEAEGEAIMNDMINDQDNYTQAEPDTQAEGYDIDAEQLFPPNGMPTQEGMTATTLVATHARCFPGVKRISQRMVSYAPAEDKDLCGAWLDISTDPIFSAEQKGFYYWRKVGKFFHERRNICENHSKAIEMISPFPRDGAPSMPSVASSKDHLKRSKKAN
jgi:hypothetical protein